VSRVLSIGWVMRARGPWGAARTDEPRLATRNTSRAAAAIATDFLDIFFLFTFAQILRLEQGSETVQG
jgi:hypothetical protein